MFFALLVDLRSDTVPLVEFQEEDRPIESFQLAAKFGNESLFIHACLLGE
jgi:hypothetical protein